MPNTVPSNVINLIPILYERALEEELNSLTYEECEDLSFTLEFEPANDNSIFESLISEYIPETVEEYERFYKDTFELDYVMEESFWDVIDPDTGDYPF